MYKLQTYLVVLELLLDREYPLVLELLVFLWLLEDLEVQKDPKDPQVQHFLCLLLRHLVQAVLSLLLDPCLLADLPNQVDPAVQAGLGLQKVPIILWKFKVSFNIKFFKILTKFKFLVKCDQQTLPIMGYFLTYIIQLLTN